MIDHEDDEPHEEGTSSSSTTTTSKPTSSSSSANNDDSSSLGAIFQTAYTSNSSQSSSNTSRSNPASSATSSTNISSTPYSATASGPRVSNTSDLFAPEMDVFFEDSSSQLFADSDHDDEVGHHHGPEHVQALFVDTSSPRRSPMPGATPGPSTAGFPSSRSTSWWQMAPTPSS